MSRVPRSFGIERRCVGALCRALLLAVFFLAAAGTTQTPAAQTAPTLAPSDTIFEIRLADGTTYIGQVIEAEDGLVTLRSTAGVRIQFQRAQIVSVRHARGRIVDGEFWREDTNRTRLFFAPTGRTLASGEGYAGLFFILPFVSMGVTDWVTVGGGLPLIGSFSDGIPFFYLTPKVRAIGTENVEVSAGMIAFFGGDETFGIGYGVGTFGSPDAAVTLGAGLPFGGGEVSDRYVAMIGGEYRIGRRSKLLSENWFVPGEEFALLTGGFRLIGERWTTDLGIATAVGEGQGIYFPIVSFSYSFGRSR